MAADPESMLAGLPVEKFDGSKDLIRRSIELYLANFGIIATCTCLVFLPVFALMDYFEPWTIFGEHEKLWSYVAVADAIGIFGAFCRPAILYAVVYRMHHGKSPGLGAALTWGMKRWGSVFGAQFVSGIIILASTLALVVPGIMAYVRYSLVSPIAALEWEGDVDAVKRSAELVKGKAWTLFGAGLGLYVGSFVLNMVIMLLVGIVFGILLRVFSDTPNVAMLDTKWIITTIAYTISVVANMVLTVMSLVAYLAWRELPEPSRAAVAIESEPPRISETPAEVPSPAPALAPKKAVRRTRPKATTISKVPRKKPAPAKKRAKSKRRIPT
jgi:hypothetical protein